MPRYSVSEAAVYIGLPDATLRAWFYGTTSGSRPYLKEFRAMLQPASSDLLSFYDIASAHVLMALKKKGVKPEVLRVVVQSLEREFPKERYPLLGKSFYFFGRELMLKKLGERLSLSRSRELGFKSIVDKFLSRLELDKEKMPLRFSPLKGRTEKGRSYIIIDPRFSAGRPIIKGRGIEAEIIAKRRHSGESIRVLAMDYRIPQRAVKEAVKYFPKAA
jgi:uncharacterized protein (DUF433 family)